MLTALAAEPMHGYRIIQEVSALSAGRVQLPVSTLYGALDRLAERHMIRVSREEVVDGRLRRYYALTDLGAEVLAVEAEQMRRNVHAATRRLRRFATGGLA